MCAETKDAKMKLSRASRVVVVGLVFATMAFTISMAIVYVRCLFEGISFSFDAIWDVALRGSLLVGLATALLAAVGGPRFRGESVCREARPVARDQMRGGRLEGSKMKEIYIYQSAMLPAGFSFPSDYLSFVKADKRPDLGPWWFLCDMPSVADFWINELERQYPGRMLVPFAKLEHTDDVACFDGFDSSGNPRVHYIHAFASVGWEKRGVVDSFSDWLEQAEKDRRAYVSERGVTSSKDESYDLRGFEAAVLNGVLVGVGSLVLLFSREAQVVVSCPFEVLTPEGWSVGHGEHPLTSIHLFGCLNYCVVSAEMCMGSILQISFENGQQVRILPEHDGLESYVMTVGGEIIPILLAPIGVLT